MRAFLADLTAKTSQEGASGAVMRALLARQASLRYGIAVVAVALAVRRSRNRFCKEGWALLPSAADSHGRPERLWDSIQGYGIQLYA